MALQFTYNSTYSQTRYNPPMPKQLIGPTSASVLIKNRGNNAIVNNKMGMPQKFQSSDNSSMWATARTTYIHDAGGGTILNGNFDSSQRTYLQRINAIGQSSTTHSQVSFQGDSVDKTCINSHLAKVRNKGCVAPPKKGAIANPYKSGGGSVLTGRGNSQIRLGSTIVAAYQ